MSPKYLIGKEKRHRINFFFYLLCTMPSFLSLYSKKKCNILKYLNSAWCESYCFFFVWVCSYWSIFYPSVIRSFQSLFGWVFSTKQSGVKKRFLFILWPFLPSAIFSLDLYFHSHFTLGLFFRPFYVRPFFPRLFFPDDSIRWNQSIQNRNLFNFLR